ncbi:MAG: hypothetical protein J2O48_04950 [Solirubrobacterales bacterium]|nr:hypothetical protein [Solirubrobacterales bacterium]
MSAPGEYRELLAEIAAGTRLHYANQGSQDPDLDLLEGDRSYAAGLQKLAQMGDLAATRTLGDAISAIAQAHADGDPAAADRAWQQAMERLAE